MRTCRESGEYPSSPRIVATAVVRFPPVRAVLTVLLSLSCACNGSSGGSDDDAGAGSPDAGAVGSDASHAGDAGGGTLDAAARDGATPVRFERWFEDVTARAGIDLDRTPAQAYATVPDRMSGGICVLDVDGVPPLDLFFAVRPSADSGSRLYVGRAPLSYADETSARGLDEVGDAVGCLAFDAEGDGDDDLLVTGLGTLRLFLNEGGAYVDRSALLGLVPDPRDLYMSAAAGDVDGDGDLDLAVAGFMRFDPSRYDVGSRCSLFSCLSEIEAFDFLPDLLFVRRPGGSYDERARDLAPELMEAEPGLVVSLGDLDEDGDADLYVGNDLGLAFRDRALIRGTDGVMRDAAETLGLAYNRRGYGIDTMGWASGDLDGDGRLDHVATSFEGDATAVFLCGAAGCEDRADAAGTVALERSFRWGAALVDLDLDGHHELVEAVGHYYEDGEVALLGLSRPRDQPQNLMVGLPGGTFRVAVLDPTDGLSPPGSMRGIAVADLDEDGRPDVVLAPALGPPRLLRNVRPPVGHSLRVRLVGRAPNAGGVGARVTVIGARRRYVRERRAGEGFLGSFDPRLFFGFEEAGPVDLEVRWPTGEVTRLFDQSVDREITVRL